MGRKKGQGLMHDRHGWGEDYAEYYGHAYQGGNGYKVKKGWNTGDAPKVCENCDFLPKTQKQKIMINYEVWKALLAICATIKIEWQALLIGSTDAEGVVHVTGYWIPRQEVTGTSVRNLELVDDEVIAAKGIVAGVHSHGTMGVFFSSTDVEDTNMSLIKHNIVINNESKYKAQSRVELPCGLAKFVEAEVFTVGETNATIVGLENIIERKYVSSGYTPPTTYVPIGHNDDKELKGVRWCPVCEGCPEEDGGMTCVCWTKGSRLMLPDFTLENYVLNYGRSYDLKPELLKKFKS